jgi:hypothetical protein
MQRLSVDEFHEANKLPLIVVLDDNLRAFLIELILLYCFVDWICHIRPIYHILKLHRQTGKLDAIAALCQRMLRDLVHHQQMAKLIIKTAFEENGHVANLK